MPKVGASLIANALHVSGTSYEVLSPYEARLVGRISIASREEIRRALDSASQSWRTIDFGQALEFLQRLRNGLELRREELISITCLETAFTIRDCEEMVGATIDYLAWFPTYYKDCLAPDKKIPFAYGNGGSDKRTIRLTAIPYGVIAAVTPQNAALPLNVIVLANALAAGNSVILRPSLKTGCSSSLLAEVIQEADPPAGSIQIVNCEATDFFNIAFQSAKVGLVHYIGSNHYVSEILAQSIASGKDIIVDGQGNGLLFLDESFPLELGIRIVVEGATRYNGQTCTSINGVLVEETIYEVVREKLLQEFSGLRLGDPFSYETDVGPLFSARQGEYILSLIESSKSGQIEVGGKAEGNFLHPTVVSGVDKEDRLVREGFFGPSVWIKPVSDHQVHGWLETNQFPLSDTILSTNQKRINRFIAGSKAARVVIGADPSIESMFEPWGGYPPSGLNRVSLWLNKYRKAIQVDAPAKFFSESYPGTPLHVQRTVPPKIEI